ncbi:hypothetical protein IQ07DRAFT_676391 [Pyrenochaeta sp. DS3sAY3a]|nr:hypothetical protein IQ07DRAFT_676391 [Pyrenochaeta sp. DS3sAY3a]
MVNQRPNQFSGTQRFGAAPPPPGMGKSQISGFSSQAGGLGMGKGSRGLGLGKAKGLKRHMKIKRDTIYGVSKNDIRRLARRGGVRRISATIYDDVRQALKERLTRVLKDVVAVIESGGRSTVSVTDVVFVLNRLGSPIYGFGAIIGGGR